jgi:hypothetical protein
VSAVAAPPASSATQDWLLLIHHLPPKPAYLRAKVGRRLQRIGALAIKNSVYVLPARDGAYEDFQWLRQEIEQGGGTAAICQASFLEGFSQGELVSLFQTASDVSYRQLIEEVRGIRRDLRAVRKSDPSRRNQLQQEVRRVRARFDALVALDFFGARTRARAETALNGAEAVIRGQGSPNRNTLRNMPKGRRRFQGRTWVTRTGVHVDRIASAWLIRRFIDPAAHIRFVSDKGYVLGPGELRFDMFDGEYTHEGEDCTFETLLRRFAIRDASLHSLAEVVHDIDVKDGKFARREASGIELAIAGICAAYAEDDARIERGAVLFDELYAAMSAKL